MNLGEKIKQIRKDFGLTQEKFAEKLNVSRQAIAKWELNNGIPDVENLKMISSLFGISIDVLLDNTSIINIKTLNQSIDLKKYGKLKGEQYLNVLNENFGKDWDIYILSYSKKINTIGGMIDLITFGISKLEDLSPYFLAIKENEDKRIFINIKNNILEMILLSENININKFELDEKVYTNYGLLKR